jgi:hypothetical protein
MPYDKEYERVYPAEITAPGGYLVLVKTVATACTPLAIAGRRRGAGQAV